MKAHRKLADACNYQDAWQIVTSHMVDCAANFSLAGDNQTISGTAKDIAEHNENLFCGLRKHYLCVIELAKCRMKLLVSLGDRFIFLFGGDVKSHCLLKVCIPGT